MRRASKSVLAALLMTAVLAAPGGAFASVPAVASTKPMETRPAPAPATGGESDVLVEPKLSRDQAIAVVKQYFTIPAELGEPNVGIQQSRESAVWSMEWQSSRKQAEQSRITARVDAVTGTLLQYSTWSTGDQAEALQLSFTRAEAKAKALEWFKRVVPAEYQESLREVESPLNASYWGSSRYQFNWVRQVKGYPFTGNGVHITVDARSGAMVEYNLNWRSSIELTLPEKILTATEAEEAYRQVPMVLQYQRFTKRGTEESEWKLVYRPLTDSFPRMNQEGVLINWQGEPLDLEALTLGTPVPASDEPYQKPAKALGQEEALQIARAITGRAEAPNSSSYSEYGDETKRRSWDFTWVTEGGEKQRRTEQRVRIDAETGLVIELHHWFESRPFGKDEEVPVSLEQAQEKAIAFLRAHRPDLAGNLVLRTAEKDHWVRENPDYKPTEYHIRFQQLKNGLPVMGRDLSLSINARTGEIRSFWSGWWDEKSGEEFPTPQAMLSTKQALDVFFKHQGIEAAWVIFWSPREGGERHPDFVWQPSSRLNIQSIDAKTGAPMDWEGRNLVEAMRYPSDIKGHYAEREIELLWARGVFELQDGKFNPDMVVSVDELARWIVLTRGLRPIMSYDFALAEAAAPRAAKQMAGSANSAYFGAALQSGIILPEDLAELGDLNGTVPREMFALWAARAMGYGRIAKMEARIEMNFADKDEIGAKYRNAVALLAGLGIVSGDAESRFGPQRWLTRADAVKILFAVSAGR